MGWMEAAKAADVNTGSGTVVHVEGLELALFNVNGTFYCIDNLCPHRDGPLADGELEEDVVMCPWHAWQINVRTGEVLYNPNVCVRSYPCKVEADAVFIEI